MKKIVLSLLAMSLLCTALAQTSKCGIDTKALVAEEVAAGSQNLRFLVKMKPGYPQEIFDRMGAKLGTVAGDIVTVTLPASRVAELESNPFVMQYSIAHRVGGPLMDRTRMDTRTDKVEAGSGVTGGNGYDGTGVLIGITDWGFDYTHPNFNNGPTKNRRIERAWDQYRLSGPAPAPYDYGTEIIGYTDLVKAKGDTSNLYGYGTHGTHVAGICAGAGTESKKFRGQAPGAHLLLCSFGLNEADWIDGAAWMERVAEESDRRLVINSSWGMYSFSCLDGKSLLSQAIDNMSDEGVVFVTSGGNNGDANFHISRDFSQTPDTLKTVAAFYTYAEDAIGQCLIMWGEEGHDFSASFRMRKDSANVWSIPMVNTAGGDKIVYDTLWCDTVPVPYRILCEQVNPFDNRPHIQIDVDRAGSLQLQLFIAAESGTVHAWNVANKTNHAGNEGAAFHAGSFLDFARGDNFYGVGEPACAHKAIGVAAHNADSWSYDSTQYYTGEIASFSSFGPLIDGRQKPEISAPGYQVNSSISFWSDTKYNATAEYIYKMKTYIWARMSGTSMSGPAVTGIVALLLQANPTLRVDELRDIIFTTARNDDRTGDLLAKDSVSVRWGWGKIDALAAINKAIAKLSVAEAEELQLPMYVYPNPAQNVVTVSTGCGEWQTVSIYSVSGQPMMSVRIQTEGQIDVSQLPRGVYVVRAGSRCTKLVLQ